MIDNNFIPVIPEKDDHFLRKLIDKIGLEAEPVIVKIMPSPEARISECFPNVDYKVDQDGGVRVIGWQIWKTKNLIEAEFHSVWKTDEKELVDITPRIVPLTEILFIEDCNRP
ncbi:MAG: hypothetical protein ACJAS1_005435 [Oleiphilaceae bacterium]|jgi:hypothetical protein